MSLPPPENDSERLDRIVWHLDRMDHRDKMRTVGGFFRNLIALVPVLLVIWSSWYFYQHGDEIMKKIADAAAQSAQQASENAMQKAVQALQGKKK